MQIMHIQHIAVFKHGNSMAYQIPRKTQKWWVGFGKTFAGSPVLVETLQK